MCNARNVPIFNHVCTTRTCIACTIDSGCDGAGEKLLSAINNRGIIVNVSINIPSHGEEQRFNVTIGAEKGVYCDFPIGKGEHGEGGHSHHEAKEEGNESTDASLFFHKKAPFK